MLFSFSMASTLLLWLFQLRLAIGLFLLFGQLLCLCLLLLVLLLPFLLLLQLLQLDSLLLLQLQQAATTATAAQRTHKELKILIEMMQILRIYGKSFRAAIDGLLSVQNTFTGIAQRLLEYEHLLLLLLLQVQIACVERIQTSMLVAIISAYGIVFAAQHLQIASEHLNGFILLGQQPMGLTMRRMQLIVAAKRSSSSEWEVRELSRL